MPSSSGDMEAQLEAELAALKKRELETRRELKQASRKRAKLNARRNNDLSTLVQQLGSASLAGTDGLSVSERLASHKDRLTLLALFKLSDHSADAVAYWVLRHGVADGKLRSSYVDVDPEAKRCTVAGVEWLYILSSVEDINTSVESASRDAYYLGRYVVEYKLFLWAIKQNCDHGVAPHNRQLFAEAIKSVPSALPDAVGDNLKKFFLENNRHLRRWALEFRGRWCIERGRLGSGENLEPLVLHSRVTWIFFAAHAGIPRLPV